MSPRLHVVFVAVVQALLLSPITSAADEPSRCSFDERGAVVMVGPGPTLTPGSLARCAAPALWFSPDEPRNTSSMPSPLPLVGTAGSLPTQVAYYRIHQVTSNRRVVIRYMFYYDKDVGFGGHWHDLESVEVTLSLRYLHVDASRRPTDDMTEARISQVAGSAHGLGWYSNILRIEPDDRVALPLRILVEEGKHASAPDRNGDGFYNPGFDVNAFTRDAWGVRDTLVSRYQPGSGYATHMTKPRRENTLVWPPASGRRPSYALLASTAPTLSSPTVCAPTPEGGFRRRPLTASDLEPSFVATVTDKEDGAVARLNDLLAERDFCKSVTRSDGRMARIFIGYGLVYGVNFLVALNQRSPGSIDTAGVVSAVVPVLGFTSSLIRNHETTLIPSRPFLRPLETPQIAANWDGGRPFFVFGVPALISRVPGIDGQLAFRYAFRHPIIDGDHSRVADAAPVKVFGSDLLYTPSVARIADWYVSVGADEYRSAHRAYAKVALEGGVRLRFPTEWRHFIPFVGMRVGVRISDLRSAAAARPVMEVGMGAF